MNVILLLISIISLIVVSVLVMSWKYGIIGQIDGGIMGDELTYYSIGSILINSIGLIIFIYSVYISTNYINLPSDKIMNLLFYLYMFLFYVTFIIIVIYLGYKKQLKISKKYITTNSIFLLLLVPFIIFRNQLYFEETIYDIEEEDFIKLREEGGALDDVEYDNKGNRVRITDPDRLKVRVRAVESEYNERIDVESGVYD
mgnify:FL=1